MVELSPQQSDAVRGFEQWWSSVANSGMGEYRLAGLAGTGKSTIVPALLESTRLSPERVAFLGPTGKAVKVLKKKLKEQGIRSEASTIHSAIYHPKIQSAEALEEAIARYQRMLKNDPHLDPQRAHELQEKIRMTEDNLRRLYLSNDLQFLLNPDSQKLETAQLIIVDEASMVDQQMANDLRGFGIPILAIGDPGQLPPVAGSPGFDLQQPDSFLSEIHRQAADNPILWLAHKLRQGESAPLGNHGDRLRVIRAKDDDVTFDLERDVQIICGRNNTRWDITRKTRHLSGIGDQGPVEGELMICVRNSKKRPSMVNGSMYMVTESVGELRNGDDGFSMNVIDEEGVAHKLKAVQAILEENYLGKNTATVDQRTVYRAKGKFEHFDWAYAITCHKSQGSQWDEVCVHDEGWCFRDDAARWNYTAATRAAERLTWVI